MLLAAGKLPVLGRELDQTWPTNVGQPCNHLGN